MIRDDKGKIALDYVDDIASDYLQHEAREILVQNTKSIKTYMGGKPPVRKATSKRTTVIIYYLLFICIEIVKSTTLY